MLELSPYRKNKINLEDYDYRQDIKNRMLLSNFSQREREILEELLYSPSTIPLKQLASQLDLEISELLNTLNSLESSNLFKIEADKVVVNKEVRKYFESHAVKFEEDFFIPNMEFLQSLLKKVPIHILPNWYHIPRTSNNIFHSLIEKYLLTPQVFQRYLKELNLGNTALNEIVQEVYNSEELKVSSEDLRKKFNLDVETFEEYMLHLEFNFVCCLGSEKIGDSWIEIVAPFHEWREYLFFLKKTDPDSFDDAEPFRKSEYAFAEDLAAILNLAFETSLSIKPSGELDKEREICEHLQLKMDPQEKKSYLQKLISTACKLQYAEIRKQTLVPLEEAKYWLELSLEKQALQIYKHPLNAMEIDETLKELATPKNIREIEKSVSRIVEKEWVYYEEFLKGAIIQLSEENNVMLKKEGRQWRYALPQYTEDEKALIEKTLLDWLFEGGIISKGLLKGKPCLKLTSLGKALFA